MNGPFEGGFEATSRIFLVIFPGINIDNGLPSTIISARRQTYTSKTCLVLTLSATNTENK